MLFSFYREILENIFYEHVKLAGRVSNILSIPTVRTSFKVTKHGKKNSHANFRTVFREEMATVFTLAVVSVTKQIFSRFGSRLKSRYIFGKCPLYFVSFPEEQNIV